MTVYVGVDLHSNNNYVGIVNEANAVLFKKKLPNDLSTVLTVLEPFRNDTAGIAVESTFNWYWFVDGLMDNGYKVHLANPAAIQQYEGLKNIDDKRSALWLAGPSQKTPAVGAASNLPYLKYQEHHEPEPWDEDEER